MSVRVKSVLLFLNSLWSMAVMVYSLDPVGILRRTKAFFEKQRALAKFGTLEPGDIKNLLHEQDIDIWVPKKKLEDATSGRAILGQLYQHRCIVII